MPQRNKLPHRVHAPLLAILAAFLALATYYNVSLPLFEAPDEISHYRYISWLADGNALPNLTTDLDEVGHEAGQPPLYYALLAPIVAPLNGTDPDLIAPRNPLWREAWSPNVHYHPTTEAFPYRGTTLAVHLARFFTSLMATITIVCTYWIARYIEPTIATLAAALVAFNPQFIFMSAALSNDTLVTALSAVTLLVVIRSTRLDLKPYWRFLLLGALLGLTMLSKISGLALGVTVAVVIVFRAWKRHSWRELVGAGAATALGMLGVSGWWLLRNWTLYRHPLAWEQFLNANKALLRDEPLSWIATLRYAVPLSRTYWAFFAQDLFAPDVFYWFTAAISVLAGAGLLAWLVRNLSGQSRRKLLAVGLLVLWTLVVFVSLLNWMQGVRDSNQGRLLFPAVSAVAVLMALGLATLSGRRRWLAAGAVAALAAWAVAMPLLVIRPAFAAPEPLDPSQAIPNPTSVRFGDDLALTGYALRETSVPAGGSLEVDIYWQGLRPMTENYMLRFEVLDAEGRVVAAQEILPFQGRYPTFYWSPDEVYEGTYRLPPISSDASPGRGTLTLSVFPQDGAPGRLPVTVHDQATGETLTLTDFKIAPIAQPDLSAAVPVEASFAKQYRLLGYHAPAEIQARRPFTVDLYWEALEPNGRDYTVFLHLIDESGELVAQDDSPPLDNRFPTSLWTAGERIVDPHQFPGVPEGASGTFRLVAGLYDPTNGERLPAYQDDGTRWPDDAVILGVIRVAPES